MGNQHDGLCSKILSCIHPTKPDRRQRNSARGALLAVAVAWVEVLEVELGVASGAACLELCLA